MPYSNIFSCKILWSPMSIVHYVRYLLSPFHTFHTSSQKSDEVFPQHDLIEGMTSTFLDTLFHRGMPKIHLHSSSRYETHTAQSVEGIK